MKPEGSTHQIFRIVDGDAFEIAKAAGIYDELDGIAVDFAISGAGGVVKTEFVAQISTATRLNAEPAKGGRRRVLAPDAIDFSDRSAADLNHRSALGNLEKDGKGKVENAEVYSTAFTASYGSTMSYRSELPEFPQVSERVTGRVALLGAA